MLCVPGDCVWCVSRGGTALTRNTGTWVHIPAPVIMALMICVTPDEHSGQKCPSKPKFFVTIMNCICKNEELILGIKWHDHNWRRQLTQRSALEIRYSGSSVDKGKVVVGA